MPSTRWRSRLPVPRVRLSLGAAQRAACLKVVFVLFLVAIVFANPLTNWATIAAYATAASAALADVCSGKQVNLLRPCACSLSQR